LGRVWEKEALGNEIAAETRNLKTLTYLIVSIGSNFAD